LRAERGRQDRERRERQRMMISRPPLNVRHPSLFPISRPYSGKTGPPGSMGYPVPPNTGDHEAPGFSRPIPGLGGKAWEHDSAHGG
jgi:hypothetical protein